MQKQNRKRNFGIIAAVTTVMVLGGLGTANAVNQFTGADIKDQSLSMADLGPDSVNQSEIRANAVSTSEVKDGSLTLDDINDTTEAALAGQDGEDGAAGQDGTDGVNGQDGAPGTDGEDGADGVIAPVYVETPLVNVAKIGGSFKTNATLADTVDLPAGKYILTANGFFRSNQATSGETTLQTALRVGWGDGNTFGTDLGTAFTGGSPTAANREVSNSTTRVVTLTETTTVQLLVFGYDNAGGSADSGKFDAQVFLTATPVQ